MRTEPDGVSPLVGCEDRVPFDPSTSLLLGDTFQAAYVSPLGTRVGAGYRLHGGLGIETQSPASTLLRLSPPAGTYTLSVVVPNGVAGVSTKRLVRRLYGTRFVQRPFRAADSPSALES